MTQPTRTGAYQRWLAKVGPYVMMYLASFAVFELFGLEKSYFRPFIPVFIALVVDYRDFLRQKFASHA